MNSRIPFALAGMLAGAISANAGTDPDILGTWTGTHENLDPNNSSYGQINPMLFVVQSEVGSSISGDWNWLSGDANGCTRSPCTTTWSGTITSTGQLDVVGEFGDDYVASLIGNTISGTFSGPESGNTAGYGTWTVSMTQAPEISSGSAASALTLLLGGLMVLTGRRSKV
jgi:hypothetical protein